MKQYTTPSPERIVMRTHVFGLYSSVDIAGIELWIMIEPEGNVWTWDGWMWH